MHHFVRQTTGTRPTTNDLHFWRSGTEDSKILDQGRVGCASYSSNGTQAAISAANVWSGAMRTSHARAGKRDTSEPMQGTPAGRKARTGPSGPTNASRHPAVGGRRRDRSMESNPCGRPTTPGRPIYQDASEAKQQQPEERGLLHPNTLHAYQHVHVIYNTIGSTLLGLMPKKTLPRTSSWNGNAIYANHDIDWGGRKRGTCL